MGEGHKPLPEQFRPGLRAALLAAIASGVAVTTEPPAEAAPARKPVDELRQVISPQEMRKLDERQQIINARVAGRPRADLERKNPELSVYLDVTGDAAVEDLRRLQDDAYTLLQQYLAKEQLLRNECQSMQEALNVSEVRYFGVDTPESTQATEQLQSIFRLMNEVSQAHPREEDFTINFPANPDVQTMGRIKDLTSRIDEFLALPKNARDHAIAESVRIFKSQSKHTNDPLPFLT